MLKCLNAKMLKNRGFTLVEMMVTLLIFSIIVGTTVGVFVSVIRIQKYNLSYHQLLAQTSYAIEYMARAIRMAKKNTDGICSGMADKNYEETHSGHGVRFETYHSPGQCWEFFLEEEKLKVLKNNEEKYDLTSGDFNVTSFNVVVSGDGADQEQPRVTVFMEVRGEGSAFQPGPRVRIQTTISQRNLDF